MRKFDKSGCLVLQTLLYYAIFVLNDKAVKNVIKKKIRDMDERCLFALLSSKRSRSKKNETLQLWEKECPLYLRPFLADFRFVSA